SRLICLMSEKLNIFRFNVPNKEQLLSTEKDAEQIVNKFMIRSEEIKQEGFIEQKYQEFSNEHIKKYIRKIAGFGKWKSRIYRRLFKEKLLINKYSKQDLLAIQNYIKCELHK